MLNLIILAGALGVAGMFATPSLLRSTTLGPRVGNAYVAFAASALRRPAISVGKHGDLLLRQLAFDDVYEQETVTIGGVEKKITRTAKNVHRLGKTPFSFVDEVWGVTFDLRDVLISGIEHRHRDNGEMVVSEMDFDTHGNPTNLTHYVRAFFEVSEREALDMDLDNSVRRVVDGNETASMWEAMWEAVRRMYIGYQEDLSFWKLLVPVTAGLLAFATGYYVLGPGQMPGGSSGGGGSPISVGTLLLLSTTDPKELLSRVREKIEKRHVVQAGAMLAVKAVVVGSISVFGVGTSLILFGAFLGGAALLPLLTLILGAVGKGENLAELLMMIGLMGFDDPMFDLGADDQYRVVEAEAVGLEGTPRTKFAKSLVGFTCDVSPEAFGHAGHSAADLEDYRPVQLVADGGAASLPRGYVPTEGMTNANHQGFMPADPSPSTTFVRSDTWLGRFRDSATGAAIAVAEQEATKKFAAGDAEISDNRLMKLSAVAAALGIGFWVVIALV